MKHALLLACTCMARPNTARAADKPAAELAATLAMQSALLLTLVCPANVAATILRHFKCQYLAMNSYQLN